MRAERIVKQLFLLWRSTDEKVRLPQSVRWVDSPNETSRRDDFGWTVWDSIIQAHGWRLGFPVRENWGVTEELVAAKLRRHGAAQQASNRADSAPMRELLFDLYSCGAFAVSGRLSEELCVIARPSMSLDDQGRLHNTRKAAAGWPEGPYTYALHGVEVPQHVITREKPMSLRDIQDIENQEVRRVVIERFGWKKYLKAINAWVIDEDPVNGVLWGANTPDGDLDWRRGEQRLLELKDPSTSRKYFIRVPPGRNTAASARAWTLRTTVSKMKTMVKET